MKCPVWMTAVAICVSNFVAAAAPASRASADEAIALTKRAVAHYKSVGKDKAFADFSTKGGAFTDRELYVGVSNLKTGVIVAHGANDKMVGKDLTALKDADGKPFMLELMGRAREGQSGWTDYRWPNPVSKELEAKRNYCEPHDGHVFCVGVYR